MTDPQPPTLNGPHQSRVWKLRRAAILLAVMLGAIDLVATAVLFSTTAREADERRAENCKLFTNRWRADVGTVGQTANYLRLLTPAEARTSLNQRIAANLSMTIERAVVERPPAYCNLTADELGRGQAVLLSARRQVPQRPDRPR